MSGDSAIGEGPAVTMSCVWDEHAPEKTYAFQSKHTEVINEML